MSRPQYVHSRREEPEIGPEWISIGVIVGAVGVKGAVRLKVFTDDLEAVLLRGAVTIFPDQHSTGEKRDVTLMHKIKVGYACQISGLDDRDQAESLRGVKLYVPRDELPKIEEDGSYYYEDMEGLIARDTDGTPFGVVHAIYNFGAGDLVEVQLDDVQNGPASGTKMYPFRDQFVPEVNIEQGYLVIDRAAYGEDQESAHPTDKA
ncbi:MAG: 16S rRNA processing protein RimM [Alphaproteobacteria bacterium]|nr:MAG: 16S rRNA processing protein RimM [Alphaproteobacteria bacterium]